MKESKTTAFGLIALSLTLGFSLQACRIESGMKAPKKVESSDSNKKTSEEDELDMSRFNEDESGSNRQSNQQRDDEEPAKDLLSRGVSLTVVSEIRIPAPVSETVSQVETENRSESIKRSNPVYGLDGTLYQAAVTSGGDISDSYIDLDSQEKISREDFNLLRQKAICTAQWNIQRMPDAQFDTNNYWILIPETVLKLESLKATWLTLAGQEENKVRIRCKDKKDDALTKSDLERALGQHFKTQD